MDVKRGLLLLALAAVVGGGIFAYVSVSREQAFDRLITAGNAALEADQTFEALEAFSGAIAIKGDSMFAYLRRGETYLRQGQPAAAERDLRRASRLDPTAPRPLEALGDVHFQVKNYARAAERYADYVRLDDRSARVLYKLALSRYRAGDPRGAILPLRQAVAIDERLAEAHYLLGLCLRSTGQSRDATAELERAIRIAPTLLVAREELADVYWEMGRTRDEVVQLESLTALDARPARFVALGLAYARTGQHSQAVRVLGAATERFPEHPGLYVTLGRLWLENAQNGHDRVALSKALEALRAVPDDSEAGAEAKTLYGRALLMSGDRVLAERALQEAVTKYPLDPQAFLYLADAAEGLGHVSDARQALLRYQALVGDDPNAAVQVQRATRIANLSSRLSDPATAAVWLEQAASVGQPTVRLLAQLAQAQIESGDSDGARETIQRALAIEPRNRTLLALERKVR
jgi:tetratricopeptide (TPR) repeat protein